MTVTSERDNHDHENSIVAADQSAITGESLAVSDCAAVSLDGTRKLLD